MKRLALFVALLVCACNSNPVVLNNPLDIKMGDPFVLLSSDGFYYMYGTTCASKGYEGYRSANLSDWEPLGVVYEGLSEDSWCTGNFWAPEVVEKDGKWYMFYSADWRDNPTGELENFRIGVAVASDPAGPFEDMFGRPVFDPGYPIIDADVFIDEDGSCYLYYSRCCYKHPVESEVALWAREQGWYEEIEESWVYGVKLSPDFSGVEGEPVMLLCPPYEMSDSQAEWESRSVTCHEAGRRWTEGSFLFKKDGVYVMMYSANFFGGENYALGYATAQSPLGPFTKSEDNPVLEKNTALGGTVTGVGHNSVTFSPDGKQMYCVYHGRTTATGDDRVVFIDRMFFEDGHLSIVPEKLL